MDKNPPANAGDTGLIPGAERPHMPQSNQARVPQLPSPHAATTEAHMSRAYAPQQEKPAQWQSPCAATGEQPPITTTKESPAQPVNK